MNPFWEKRYGARRRGGKKNINKLGLSCAKLR
jgi:hypothetical protein